MSDKIVIIDYEMGNLRSVQKAFEKMGNKAIISRDPESIKSADKIVLPGVGAFKDAMKNLKKYDLIEQLHNEVITKKKPFLGICLGMQLIAKKSHEFGETEGLGWIDAEIVKFDFEADNNKLKVPHVGWNDITYHNQSGLFKNIPNESDFYFVHSYYFYSDDKYTTSHCNYGKNFISSIQKENIYATQFHPEKSQNYGLKIIQNFINIGSHSVC